MGRNCYPNKVFSGGSEDKESACKVGDPGSVPGLGRSHGEGHGNPLQYSCLESPMDRGAWWTMVHRVAESWTRLKRLSMHNIPQILLLTFFIMLFSSPVEAWILSEGRDLICVFVAI